MGGKEKDDEMRIFYVGATRTKHNLFLYQPDFTYGEYKNWNTVSPKFTMKDYINYTNQDKTRVVYDTCE